MMRLAQVQMMAQTHSANTNTQSVKEAKEASLSIARSYIEEAAGQHADIVMLPEMFCCPYDNSCFPIYAESEGDLVFTSMADAARENHVYLIAGSMPEKDEEGHIYNTAYVFDRDGQMIAKHRKAHLFDIDIKGGQYFKESDTLSPGGHSTVFDTEFGRMGLMICYDIRFPELSMRMTLDGAKMIFVPACFNMTTGPCHWTLAFRSRAVDNQVFMAGCSQSRITDGSGYIAYGHSIVTSPWGDVLTEMDEKEGIAFTDIDLSMVEKIRSQLPFLQQRRPELY